MTTFKYALMACGLSQQEAADFLEASLQTVKDWSRNRKRVPEGVWLQIGSLYEQIQVASENAAEVMQLDGIDPRAWSSIAADLQGNELPTAGAANMAGATALLMRIADMARLDTDASEVHE